MATSQIILAVFLAWLIAQVAKVITTTIKNKKPSFGMVFKTGGMPSAHTTFVSALSTSIGLTQGFSSVIFLVTASFSFIVIYDSFAVRGVIGQQLNKIIKPTLSEVIMIGHSVSEVLMGMVIGIGVPLLLL